MTCSCRVFSSYFIVVHVPTFCTYKSKHPDEQSLLCTWCFEEENLLFQKFIQTGAILQIPDLNNNPTIDTTRIPSNEQALSCSQLCLGLETHSLTNRACHRCSTSLSKILVGHFLGMHLIHIHPSTQLFVILQIQKKKRTFCDTFIVFTEFFND